MSDLATIKQMLVLTAEYYGKPLSDKMIMMMASDLEDLPLESIRAAFNAYRRDPNSKFFPLPAQIRAIAAPMADEKSLAVATVTILEKAIRRKGRSWATGYVESKEGEIVRYWEGGGIRFDNFEAAMREELGELAFLVVQRMGWNVLCELAASTDAGTFHAQLRERVLSIIKLHKAGELNTKPSLPKISASSENAPNRLPELQKLLGVR